MINTSSDYKAQVLKDGCQWKALAEIKYNDGAVISISNESIMENGLSFYDGTSQKNKFCVGSFVSKMITLKLCNFESKFVEGRFQGAQIHLKFGLFIEDTQLWEWIDLGTFFVDKHPTSGGIITLTAYNNAVNFEKKYDSQLPFPATLAEILQDACANCGVPLYSATFPNSDYVVTARPSDDATTYADIVSDVAQLSACFAKCNNLGQLVLDWYDLDRFYPESGNTVDGNDALIASGNPAMFDAYPDTLIRRLNVTGNTLQTVTQPGKNLLGPKPGTITSNGITCTVASDGTITLNGTATGKMGIEISPILRTPFLPNTIPIVQMENGSKYTISKTVVSGTKSANESIAVKDATTAATNICEMYENPVTITAGTAYSSEYSASLNVGLFRIYINTGNSFQQYAFRFQFEQSASATSWVPFVPESPSPDYPAPITGVNYIEKWEGVLAGGRNLLLNSNFQNVLSNWTLNNPGGTGATSVIADATFGHCAKIIAVAQYQGIYQVPKNRVVGNQYCWSVWLKADSQTTIWISHESGEGSTQVSVGTSWTKFIGTGIWHGSGGAFCLYPIGACTFYIAQVKYEQNATATDYSPAPEDLPSYQKTMLPQTLFTGDSYDLISGQGTAASIKELFIGATGETWSYESSSTNTAMFNTSNFLTNLKNDSSGGTITCSHFVQGTTAADYLSDRECIFYPTGGNGFIRIKINKSRLSGWSDSWTNGQKITAFKTWLAGQQTANTPVTARCELATPATITGTPASVTASTDTTVSCDNGGNVEVTYSGPDALDGGPFYPSAPATDGGSFADYADDDTYDGGGFTDYSEADYLDGGNFIDYGATPSDIVSGGVFRKNLLPPAQIASLTDYEVATKDIRITGVQIVPVDKDKSIIKQGTDGYVISIENNLLAQDNLDALVNSLAKRLIDFYFRPMEATGWDDPSYEAGDVAVLTDPYGNQYQTIISNLEYNIGDYESYSADAESESDNQSVSFDAGAKAAQAARADTTRQITAYDQAVGAFTSMAALAMGLYSTKQQLDDGSFILYWHDKPNLTDSQTIWKLTKNVFVVSDDGGNSWRGMDKDGNILAKVLNVIGINADWINAGTIKVGGLTGKSIVSLSDDGNMRCVQNGTDGFVIQQKVGSDWVTTWQADSTSGKTIAYNLNHTQKVEMGGDVGYRTYLWNDLFGWMLTGGQGADGGTGASKIFNPEAPYDYGMIGATPEGNSGLTLFHNGYEFCRLLDTGGGEGTGFALVLSNESWPFGASTDGSTYMKYGNSGTPSEVACGDGLINFDIGGKVCGAVGTNGVQANTVSGDLPCKGATGYGDFTLHIDHGVITGWDNR